MSERADPPTGQAGRSSSAPPRPVRPRVPAHSMYLLHGLLEPNAGYRRLASWLESRRRLGGVFTAGEERVKHAMFGCRMCGQCSIPLTAYTCPMTCPKQLRNGPCGGVGQDGSCEVYPDTRCVWLVAYERAESEGTCADLLRLQRPIDNRRWGQSSWLNYWQGRDEDLCADRAGHG